MGKLLNYLSQPLIRGLPLELKGQDDMRWAVGIVIDGLMGRFVPLLPTQRSPGVGVDIKPGVETVSHAVARERCRDPKTSGKLQLPHSGRSEGIGGISDYMSALTIVAVSFY